MPSVIVESVIDWAKRADEMTSRFGRTGEVPDDGEWFDLDDEARSLLLRVADHYAETEEEPAIVIDRLAVESWAGPLTGEQIERLNEVLHNSSVPDAIATIADSIRQEGE